MDDLLDQFREKFVLDATDLISDLEKKLLELESNPTDKDSIDEIFRVMHTLKGTAGMYGFDNIGELTHHAENVYDYIREGSLKVTTEILGLTLDIVDCLNLLLNNSDSLEKCGDKYQVILKALNTLSGTDAKVEEIVPSELSTDTDFKNYFIRLYPSKNILKRGVNPMSIFQEIIDMGEAKIKVLDENIPELNDIDIKESLFYWDVFLVSASDVEDINDIFMFFMAEEFTVLSLDDSKLEDNKQFVDLIEFDSDMEAIYSIYSMLQNNADVKAKAKEVEAVVHVEEIHNTGIAKKESDDSRSLEDLYKNKKQKKYNIRVSSEKLDELINLVSELVTTKAQLELLAEKLNQSDLSKIVENLTKLSNNFRNNALSIRLVPVESMMTHLQRLVRDLALELNKEVDFVIEGADTELDKTIINSLESPLMHLIRNSLDHGIESAEKRKEGGKSRKGIIRFIAFYSGANVFIQIQDDGGGIDPKKIHKKAVERGLIESAKELSNKEILDMIFMPGFSTAQRITGVSGRGVGLDVVRKEIADLRGEVEVDSEIGLGTSFTLKLPLTLSIIDTLLVQVGGTYLLIPLSDVELCESEYHEILFQSTSRHFAYEDDLIPFIYLREEFDIKSEAPNKSKVVIITKNERKFALVVDSVIGEHQAVLKPLGNVFRKQDFLSGASILGDGSLALVVDNNKLMTSVLNTRSVV